jgi:hypothetical protein
MQAKSDQQRSMRHHPTKGSSETSAILRRWIEPPRSSGASIWNKKPMQSEFPMRAQAMQRRKTCARSGAAIGLKAASQPSGI